MEPVSLTLGAIAAALVAKAGDKAADRAVEGGAGVLRRLVGWLRERFSGDNDADGTRAISRVEDAPDSPSRIQELADVLDRRVGADEGFRDTLKALVAEARSAGVDVGSITQSAWGSQNVQNAGVAHSQIHVTFGQPPPAPES